MKRKERRGVKVCGVAAKLPSFFSAAPPTHRDHLHHCPTQTCIVIVVIVVVVVVQRILH